MKSINKQTIELIGVIGIIASLIFVGIQLILDRRLALAEMYAFRAEARQANLRTYLESESSLKELVSYRQNHLVGTRYNLPEEWKIEQDPIISEARRLRIEINIMSWDNLLYQSSLGLLDETAVRQGIEDNFRMDPGIAEYALTAPAITGYSRAVLQEIADKVANEE